MSDREKFEAWMREREGYPYAGQYASLMWAAWQASRRAALEEAALCVDSLTAYPLPFTPDFIARRIRALAEGDKHAD